MIYFLLCEQIKILKIGYTKHHNFYLSGRFQYAQKQVPEIPILIGFMKGGIEEEKQLHEYYKDLRIRQYYKTLGFSMYGDNNELYNQLEWFLYKGRLLKLFKEWPIAKIQYGVEYKKLCFDSYESNYKYIGKTKQDQKLLDEIIKSPEKIIEKQIKIKSSSHLPSLIVQNEKIYE